MVFISWANVMLYNVTLQVRPASSGNGGKTEVKEEETEEAQAEEAQPAQEAQEEEVEENAEIHPEPQV